MELKLWHTKKYKAKIARLNEVVDNKGMFDAAEIKTIEYAIRDSNAVYVRILLLYGALILFAFLLVLLLESSLSFEVGDGIRGLFGALWISGIYLHFFVVYKSDHLPRIIRRFVCAKCGNRLSPVGLFAFAKKGRCPNCDASVVEFFQKENRVEETRFRLFQKETEK